VVLSYDTVDFWGWVCSGRVLCYILPAVRCVTGGRDKVKATSTARSSPSPRSHPRAYMTY